MQRYLPCSKISYITYLYEFSFILHGTQGIKFKFLGTNNIHTYNRITSYIRCDRIVCLLAKSVK